eukprot:2383332-Pyramimonas_sp.AAC.1
MSRRLALIKEAHRVSPSQPDYTATNQLMGWSRRAGGAAISPGLSAHVADQLRQEAAIMKEARKARVEAAARSK